jgi:hypothetical protein
MYRPVEAGESFCVAFEACIHASEGAQVLDDHVGMIEFLFNSEVYFLDFAPTSEPWWAGLSVGRAARLPDTPNRPSRPPDKGQTGID